MAGPKQKKAKKSAGRRAKRDAGSAIKKLDVPTLHDEALSEVMLHLASAVRLRRALSTTKATLGEASGSYCYTKSGSSSTVTIWSNGFIVGQSSEADAKASGIKPCG
jgi:hypothetical protein